MNLIILCSETGIAEDEKVLRRMNNQIHNTEMMMNQMLDEHGKVQVFNSAIRDKLQEEKERISQIEEALKVSQCYNMNSSSLSISTMCILYYTKTSQ